MFVFHARRFPANRADAKGYLGMSHRAMHARGCSSCSQPPAGSLTTPPRACHRCASPRLAQSRLTRPHAEISAGRLAEAAVLSLATADAHTRRIHRAARRDAAQASGAAASGVTPGPRAAPADAPPTGSMNAGSHTAAARVYSEWETWRGSGPCSPAASTLGHGPEPSASSNGGAASVT